jgi:XTP/dITP diphosphohydrolase
MTGFSLNQGGTLLVASHNEGKVREIRSLLAPAGLKILSAAELNLPEPEETETSFEGNAALKARAAALASGYRALADDSGLCVKALDNAPGIYSARWAGPDKNFMAAMERIEKDLQAKGAILPQDREAFFVCVLALTDPDGTTALYRGEVHGHIIWPPRGNQGFGYDPFFVPEGHDKSFGEMDANAKHGWTPGNLNPLSHRARAFAALWADMATPYDEGIN